VADARGRVKPGSPSVEGTAELVTSGADFFNLIGNRGKFPYGDIGVVIIVNDPA
jgi:hypothetical protein